MVHDDAAARRLGKAWFARTWVGPFLRTDAI
jgi:hypothetical protein